MHGEVELAELASNLRDLPPPSLNTPALTALGKGHPGPGTGHKANVKAPACPSEGQQGSWTLRKVLGPPWELVMVSGAGQSPTVSAVAARVTRRGSLTGY